PYGAQVPRGTGLAGAAATQPLNSQNNHPAGHVNDGTTTGGIQNNHGALASNTTVTADTRNEIGQVAEAAYRHPEKVDQAVDASPTIRLLTLPNKAETFVKDVTSRLVGDPNNLEATHIKPTM
ncbi:hypothetical protein BGX30_002213, partial [Mortierella sp. GBA39]